MSKIEIIRLYTVAEVADAMRVHQRTVRRWIAADLLGHTKLAGRAVRISQCDIDKFMGTIRRAAEDELCGREPSTFATAAAALSVDGEPAEVPV